MVQVKSLPAENYQEIIEINVPVRFYWDSDDTFDGIEFGEFTQELLPWEKEMITQCLMAVEAAIGLKKDGLDREV